MGKYFIPILPGPSPATNQNTVPGPPVPVKLAKTLHHTGPDRIQMDIPHQLKEIFCRETRNRCKDHCDDCGSNGVFAEVRHNKALNSVAKSCAASLCNFWQPVSLAFGSLILRIVPFFYHISIKILTKDAVHVKKKKV
jgi:hypothetical protein